MAQRIDRVVRKGYEDDQLVFSLILDEHGLYIVHTGNVGGLANADTVNRTGGATFARQIADQEARLTSEPLPILVHGAHSAYVPRQQVTAVTVDTSDDQPTMTLDTLTGSYTFAFANSTASEVSGLADALREHLTTDS